MKDLSKSRHDQTRRVDKVKVINVMDLYTSDLLASTFIERSRHAKIQCVSLGCILSVFTLDADFLPRGGDPDS